MWKIVNLKAKNLFSYEELDLLFVNDVCSIVTAKNKTDQGVASNGGGKSSLLEIISLSISGETIRDIVKKKIIRRGEKFGSSSIYLKNDYLNKTLLIEQDFSVSKSTSIVISEDGKIREDLKDLAPKESYKEILRLLDLTKDDLFNYFLISKEKYQSLLLSNDSTKKEVINRFSKANIVDPLDGEIKVDITSKENEIIALNLEINSINTKIDFNQQLIEDEKKIDFNSIKQTKIKSIEARILDIEESIKNKKIIVVDSQSSMLKNLSTIDSEKVEIESLESIESDSNLESELSNIIDQINKANEREAHVQSIADKTYFKIQKDIDCIITSINEKNKEKREVESFLAELEAHISDGIECPKCKHIFVLKNKEFDVNEAKEQLPELKQMVVEFNSDVLDLKSSLEKKELEKKNQKKQFEEQVVSILNQIRELKISKKSKEDSIDEKNQKIRSIKSSIKILVDSNISLEIKIKDCEKQILTHESEIIIFKNNILEIEKEKEDNSKIEDISNKILDLTNELSVKLEKLDLLKEELSIIVEWRGNFKKFKSYLANNSIKAIEVQANSSLKKMNCDLVMEIDGFRELSGGKLKEEITFEISKDGIDYEPFGSLSGGEKSKCDLATIIAVQELINMNCSSGGLDFLFVDEILESNDSVAFDGILKSLSNVKKTIFVISHVDADRFSENKINIEKINGVSKIVN